MKLGVDGGGGFLKVCLNIEDLDESDVVSKRAKYSEGVARKLFKSTSVRKLIILAVAPGVLETHQNMFILWQLLKVKDTFKTKHPRFATDLKMANILLCLLTALESVWPAVRSVWPGVGEFMPRAKRPRVWWNFRWQCV